MGFVENDMRNGVWMSLNGGLLKFSGPNFDLYSENPVFEEAQIKTGGYGIIDVGWRNNKEVWAVGGSGIMFCSLDGGKTFKYDNSASDIPGNLYQINFFGPDVGFVLGSDGVLLRYNVTSPAQYATEA
jgi:photosystem II stability/assembly factor-like uncharacterized protein